MALNYQALLSEERPGTLRFGGARMALLDIEAGLWGLRRQLETLVGRRLTDGVLQQAGANGGASFARAFALGVPPETAAQALRDCIAAYQAAGFGHFEIQALEWPIGRVLIRGTDTFEAWMMLQHEQRAEAPACAYTAGVLVGFVNILAGRHDVVCVERTCQAQSDDACLFELLPSQASEDVPVVALDPDPGLGRQLNLLEMLFDRMPMGIAILDRDFHIRRYNPTWADLADRYAPSSVSPIAPGMHYFDVLPGSEPIVIPLFERVLDGETIRQEGVRLESGSAVTYWDVVLAPLLENGEVKGILNVTVDATERKQAEEALQSAYQTLEQRVEERTRELSTLLEVSHNVASTLEMEPLLGLILDQLKTVIDYSGAAIMRLDDEVMRILAYRGPILQEERMGLSFPLETARINLEVVRRREPVIIPDVKGDTPLARAFQEFAGERLTTHFGYIRCWMGVPLIVKGQTIGMLSLDHDKPNYYSPQQAKLALAFANQAAIAIENAQLFEAAERRMQDLEALYRADEEMYRHLKLNQVLQALVDVAVDILQADKSSLMVRDAQRERLVVRAAHGFSPETMAQMSFTLGEGIVGRVAASGELMVVEDTLTDPRVAKRITEPEEIHSLMHVPLKTGGQVFGVFNVSYAQPRTFSDDDRRLFLALAQRAALAIENARLYEQAQQAATLEERQRLARELHDAVTQTLFSASLIAEVLPRIWERDPDEGQRRLEELRQLTRGALAEMRTLLLELRPATLTETGLGDLLRQLAESIIGRARVPVTLEADDEWEPPAEVKVALYRIAQEALNNVAKHADATQATVSVHCQPGEVTLSVSDDGLGFDPEDISPEHLGLGIMRERAEAVGASLTIESERGQGTQVAVAWSAG